MSSTNEATESMRIDFVIGTANRGGAESQMIRLAHELRSRHHDVRLTFLSRGGPLTKHADDLGVPWEVARPTSIPSDTLSALAAYARLGRILRRRQPHIICAWLGGAIWPALLIGGALTDARLVGGLRGQVRLSGIPFQDRLLRMALKRAHAVTVNAPDLIEHATEWGAMASRVHFIPNGVDLPSWQADPGRHQPPRAVVVANFRPHKGHDLLVEALTHVTQPLNVRLIGEGQMRKPTEDAVRQRKLAGVVDFAEHPAHVPTELADAQLAIHPSRTEGLCNAILEEMAAGLPVVATDVGGTSLLVEDGVNGFLVEAGNAQMLALRIDELAADTALRLTMGEQSRIKAVDFSWPTCATRNEELFASLGPMGDRT